MLHYYLEIYTDNPNYITIQVLVGDEIIMTKTFPLHVVNNKASFGYVVYDPTLLTNFINDLRKNTSSTYTLRDIDEGIETFIYDADLETFEFDLRTEMGSTTVTCNMNNTRNEQFATQLEKINKYVSRYLLAND